MAFNGVQMALRSEETWRKMAPNAEMMLTRAGRRLIPGLELEITGLTPEALYNFKVTFERLGEFKLKYFAGKWLPGSDAENFSIREYEQPDGWQTGQTWMETGVSLAELKITNDSDITDPSFIVLRTMYRYCPVVTMTMRTSNNAPTTAIFRLELATFVAVSGHVNPRIVEIKAELNKTANKGRKRARNATTSESIENRPKRAAPKTSSGNGHRTHQQQPQHCQQPDLQQQFGQFLEPQQEQQYGQFLEPQQEQQYGQFLEPQQEQQQQQFVVPQAMVHYQQHQHLEQQRQQFEQQHIGYQQQQAHPRDPLPVRNVQQTSLPPAMQPQDDQQPEQQHHHLQQQHLELQQYLAHPMDPSEVRHVQQVFPRQQLQQYPEPPMMQAHNFNQHQQPEKRQEVQHQLPVQQQQPDYPIDPWQVAPYAEVPQESSSGGRVFRTPTMEELKQLCPSTYYRS